VQPARPGHWQARCPHDGGRYWAAHDGPGTQLSGRGQCLALPPGTGVTIMMARPGLRFHGPGPRTTSTTVTDGDRAVPARGRRDGYRDYVTQVRLSGAAALAVPPARSLWPGRGRGGTAACPPGYWAVLGPHSPGDSDGSPSPPAETVLDYRGRRPPGPGRRRLRDGPRLRPLTYRDHHGHGRRAAWPGSWTQYYDDDYSVGGGARPG
jgi:hypothetical protein